MSDMTPDQSDHDTNHQEVSATHPDDVFAGLPLLLAVPKAAKLLGISRASAYRLTASGELPSRRLGGRVYVVTAELRPLVGAA